MNYYIDAARRVQTFWQGSVRDMLHGYIANPPRAPGATLLASVGFLLFGIEPWAADLANALPLFVFVLVLLRLLSGLPLGVTLIVTIAALLIPIFGLAIVEFRPDMWCSGFTVLGTLLIALRDPRDMRTATAAGLAFAAALLMKPSFSPLIVILFGAALALRLAPSLRDAKQWRAAVRACVIVGGIAVVLGGPHYVLSLPNLLEFYRTHVFGPTAAVWSPSLGTAETVLYYVTGPATLPSLGDWIYIGMATPGVPLLLLARGHVRAWQASIVVILAFISYVVVTVLPNKGSYVGTIFFAYVAGAIIICAAFVLYALYRRDMAKTAYAAAIALLVFAIMVYRVPWLLLHGGAHPAAVTVSRHQVVDEVVSLLQSDRDLSYKKMMILPIGLYMNAETLSFTLLQQGRQTPAFIREYLSDDPASQIASAQRADYVIRLSADYPDVIPWLPSTKVAASISAALDHQEGIELTRVIKPSSGELGEIRVYRRTLRQ